MSLEESKEEINEPEIEKRRINIDMLAVGISFICKTFAGIRKEFAFSYMESLKCIIIETDSKREF